MAEEWTWGPWQTGVPSVGMYIQIESTYDRICQILCAMPESEIDEGIVSSVVTNLNGISKVTLTPRVQGVTCKEWYRWRERLIGDIQDTQEEYPFDAEVQI